MYKTTPKRIHIHSQLYSYLFFAPLCVAEVRQSNAREFQLAVSCWTEALQPLWPGQLRTYIVFPLNIFATVDIEASVCEARCSSAAITFCLTPQMLFYKSPLFNLLQPLPAAFGATTFQQTMAVLWPSLLDLAFTFKECFYYMFLFIPNYWIAIFQVRESRRVKDRHLEASATSHCF